MSLHDADAILLAEWLKPAVLIPVGLLSRLDARQLEAIIAHELAHIRRHDYLVNLTRCDFLASLVNIITFASRYK